MKTAEITRHKQAAVGVNPPSTWAVFADIYRREGIRGINKGVNAVAVRQCTNWGSRYVVIKSEVILFLYLNPFSVWVLRVSQNQLSGKLRENQRMTSRALWKGLPLLPLAVPWPLGTSPSRLFVWRCVVVENASKDRLVDPRTKLISRCNQCPRPLQTRTDLPS